jgi:hypothetical protein
MAKGKKICPGCMKEHGPRKLKCECGFAFPIKNADAKREERRQGELKKNALKPGKSKVFGTPLIYAVSKYNKKDFPPLPKKLDEKTLKEWILDIQDFPVKICGTWCKYSKTGVYSILNLMLPKLDPKIRKALDVYIERLWTPLEKEKYDIQEMKTRMSKWAILVNQGKQGYLHGGTSRV